MMSKDKNFIELNSMKMVKEFIGITSMIKMEIRFIERKVMLLQMTKVTSMLQ